MTDIASTDDQLRQASVYLRESNKWRTFEERKRAWQESHPDAEPEEYTRAIIQIAKDLGV